MIEKKRIEITLKTRQVFLIRRAPECDRPLCAECVEGSQMITPKEAAALSETSTRAIYRLIEGGGLHFIETDSGSVLVCSNSLQVDRSRSEFKLQLAGVEEQPEG